MVEAEYDVAVVGGGLSGLAAARALTRQGRAVVVLEARDRLGGRTATVEVAGHTVDVGGQWVGPGQHRVLRLIDELGLRTYRQHAEGRRLIEIDGELRSYSGFLPNVGMRPLLELGLNTFRLERAARRMLRDRPWQSPDAAALDSMTAADWIQSKVTTRQAQQVFRLAINAILAEEPERVSWLHALYYARAAGSFDRLAQADGGAQQDKLHGGAQQLSEGLQRLGEAELRLSWPVVRITDEGGHVRVASAKHELRARHLIIALAPSMCQAIAFEPELPADRRRLQQEMPMGSVIKCVIGYERPFWREAGLSGEGLSNGDGARLFFDCCLPDGGVALVAFIFAEPARQLGAMPQSVRRERVVEDLVRLYGAAAREVSWYVDKDWCSDVYAGGCYTGVFGPGVLSEVGHTLRRPCGRIHFAGTEAATHWPGYMEGAIQSGERAAREVLARV